MQFQGAVVSKSGTVFAIVVVKDHVVQDAAKAQRAVALFQKFFGKTPVILMALNEIGEPQWYGLPKLVQLVETASLESVKWRRYDIPTRRAV